MQLTLVINMDSLKVWTFELMVLLSGLLPNPKLETSVLSIWLVSINYTHQNIIQSFVSTSFLF